MTLPSSDSVRSSSAFLVVHSKTLEKAFRELEKASFSKYCTVLTSATLSCDDEGGRSLDSLRSSPRIHVLEH